MKFWKSLSIIIVLVLSTSVNAATIHIEATGLTTTNQHQLNYFSLGTEITYSLDIDIGSGTPTSVYPTLINSSITWNDGTSDQEWIISSFSGGGISHTGRYSRSMLGNGPEVNGYSVYSQSIAFDLGVNPFTTTEQLYDLVLNSSVIQLWIMTGTESGYFGSALDLKSSSITPSAIPVPAAIWLFGSGLISLVGFAKRKKS